MAIERESTTGSHMENREENRVTKSPVFIGVPSDDLPSPILLLRKYPDHRQTASDEPFSRQRPSQLAKQQRMSLHFDVVRDEAWSPLSRNLASNGNRSFMISVVRVQQCKNCARIP